MKNKTLKLCNETIHAGEKLSLALPLPELFSCTPLYMPIKVIHGKQEGPCLLVIAAVRGNELNGTEIINRLLASPGIQKLKGTLIAIPVVNVYGFMTRSRNMPGNVDLDKNFPGSEHGTHAARVAHSFLQNIFDLADYCIDLRTGFLNYTNLPQVFITPGDDKGKMMAEAFEAPVISNIKPLPHSLRTMAKEQNKPYIVYEAGEAMRFDESAIKVGIKGIANVMRKLDMLPTKSNIKPIKHFITDECVWVRASTSGICHDQIQLGQLVKKNQLLTTINDPFAAGKSEEIFSPYEAVVVGKNNSPLVHEGEAIFQLAIFPEMEQAANHFENWQDEKLK